MNEEHLYLWNVHSDADEFSYTFINVEQAIDSIRSFADIYITVDESYENKDGIIDEVINNVNLRLKSNPSDSSIVVSIGDHNVAIERITLDKHHVIYKIIKLSYYQVDDKIKKMIDQLFYYN